MNKAPAFQFYADDFIGGTITMSHEERGLYVLALCIQWGQGSLAHDDIERLGSGMAQPSLSKVKAKFELGEDGRLRQHRMEKERMKQASYRAERSESGKKGAKSKWANGSANGSAIKEPIAQPMANAWPPSPSPISILPKEPPAPAAHKKAGYAIPECFAGVDGFTDALQGWIDSRKQLRKPATDHAVQLMLGKLSQQPGRAIAALNKCILSGWQGFEWTWMDGDRNNGASLSPFDTQGGKRLMQ